MECINKIFKYNIKRYTKCTPFKYVCPDCSTETCWQSPFVKLESAQVKTEPGAVVKQEPGVKQEPTEDNEEMMDEELIAIKNSAIIVKPTRPTNGSVTTSGNKYTCVLDACSNSSCKTKPLNKLTYIKNSLHIQMRKFIKDYYQVFKEWLYVYDTCFLL